MKVFTGLLLGIASVSLCPYALGSALPSTGDLVPRGKAGIAQGILKVLQEILGTTAEKAWDWKKFPDMCAIYMQTVDGGNCWATVTCDDGAREYNPGGAGWNVCYVGGRQYFTDDRIGNFSITFTQVNGERGEGLTNPMIQVEPLNNWEELWVYDFAQKEFDDCQMKDSCDDGPYVCHWLDWDTSKGRLKRWECGVPKIGKGGAGFDSNGPVDDRGFAPGWCVAHVTQYQKPDPSVDSYGLEVKIYDNNQAEIGSTARGGPAASVMSKLPYTLEVSTGNVDDDAVSFAYAGDSWDSNNSRCKVGAYDSGSRQMDCGFTCN